MTKLLSLVALAGAAIAQTPNFLAPATYPTGGSSTLTAAGDFNGDGVRDIVTYESATQSLSILFGNAGGGYQAPVSRALTFAPTTMIAVDLNRDGKPDLALTVSGGVGVLINAGDGTFAAPAFYGAGMTANYVAAADFNHDGLMDLVVAGSGGFGVLRANGAGGYSLSTVPTTISQFWVGAADFNGDGNVDLVGDGSPTPFCAGNGDGTFTVSATTAAIPFRAAIGDFNGDGKLDLAYTATGFNQERVASQIVTMMIGTGTGQFLTAVTINFPGSRPGAVAAGDFDGDGIDDLAIWLTTPSQLFVMQYAGSRMFLAGNTDTIANATVISADVDGNGSQDLLLTSAATVTVFRDTHGNPPLLAVASLSPAAAVGGVGTQGTVTLGGPAPAGGAVIALASDNPAVAFPLAPTVTIPAGASSATFAVATSAVAASTTVGITAQWNSVALTAPLTLVAPYRLTGLTINPASQYGGSSVTGTVTLSGPADSTATMLLSTSNSAVATAPASVTVPAGATSATFPVALQPVAANAPATIAAGMAGVTQSAQVTSLAALDAVQITRAEDVVKSFSLRVEATSTDATATLTVWNASTGALIGTLSNAGRGKYNATFSVSPAVQSITVKSSLGGVATGAVTQK